MTDSPVGVTPRSRVPKAWVTPPGVDDSLYPFTCQIVVKFTIANPGRKQEIVHEYHYNPLSASFIQKMQECFDVPLMVSL